MSGNCIQELFRTLRPGTRHRALSLGRSPGTAVWRVAPCRSMARGLIRHPIPVSAAIESTRSGPAGPAATVNASTEGPAPETTAATPAARSRPSRSAVPRHDRGPVRLVQVVLGGVEQHVRAPASAPPPAAPRGRRSRPRPDAALRPAARPARSAWPGFPPQRKPPAGSPPAPAGGLRGDQAGGRGAGAVARGSHAGGRPGPRRWSARRAGRRPRCPGGPPGWWRGPVPRRRGAVSRAVAGQPAGGQDAGHDGRGRRAEPAAVRDRVEAAQARGRAAGRRARRTRPAWPAPRDGPRPRPRSPLPSPETSMSRPAAGDPGHGHVVQGQREAEGVEAGARGSRCWPGPGPRRVYPATGDPAASGDAAPQARPRAAAAAAAVRRDGDRGGRGRHRPVRVLEPVAGHRAHHPRTGRQLALFPGLEQPGHPGRRGQLAEHRLLARRAAGRPRRSAGR